MGMTPVGLQGDRDGPRRIIDVTGAEGAEIVLPIGANSWPSGPIEQPAFEHVCERICREAARGGNAVGRARFAWGDRVPYC
jgi:hypothetical protein